jgi:hypothetical protein
MTTISNFFIASKPTSSGRQRISSLIHGTAKKYRALVEWMAWRVERAEGMTPEGGRTNGRFMDRDRRGARSPKPCISVSFVSLIF